MRNIFIIAFVAVSFGCVSQVITTPFVNSTWTALDNSMNTNAAQQQQWLIIGNSIALGNTENSETSAPVTYSNVVYEWNNSTNDVEAVVGDLKDANTGSPWVNFAMNYYYQTGFKIVWNNRASSGSTVARNSYSAGNDWTTGVQNWTSGLFNEVAVCHDTLGTQQLRGIVVLLGVNDADPSTTDIDSVEIAFSTFVTQVQARYPSTPIYFINIGKVAAGVIARVDSVRNYINDLPALFNKVFVIAQPGNAPFQDWMYQTDGKHWSQFMNDAVGAASVRGLIAQNQARDSPPPLVYSDSTQSVINKFTNLPVAWQRSVNNYVQYLVDSSANARFDMFYCGLMDTQANSLQDWFRPSKQAVLNMGATWDQGEGLFTDGTDDYIDLNFIDSTDRVVSSMNNNFLLMFTMEMIGGTGTNTGVGALLIAGSANRLILDQSGTAIRGWNYSATTTQTTQSFASRSEYTMRRHSSGGTDATRYTKNNTLSKYGTSSSTAMTGLTLYAGADNIGGVASTFLSFRLGLVAVGVNPMTTAMYFKNRELLANCMVNHL